MEPETINEQKSKPTDVVKALSLVIGGYVLYRFWRKKKTTPNVVIKELNVYPIKSCKGFSVNSWQICKTGLKFDRSFMLYTPKNKRFVTQREIPKMALIKAELLTENNDLNQVFAIKLSAPNMQDITIRINNRKNDEIVDITLWKDKVRGIDQGQDVANWLTKYIGNKNKKEYRLMHLPKDHDRFTDEEWTPTHLCGTSITSYSDGYPYLICSESSLKSVNAHLKRRGFKSIPMNRFRPNIVIASDLNEAWIEDRISRLILLPKNMKFDESKVSQNDMESEVAKSMITFYLTKPCSRCTVPTIDQSNGIRSASSEPTKTLRLYRSGKVLGYTSKVGSDEDVYFGMNAINDKQNGVISVGDLMIPSFR